jgi:hypothetical protein
MAAARHPTGGELAVNMTEIASGRHVNGHQHEVAWTLQIERAGEAAIGSTLVPYSDLRTWAPRLAARNPSVLAVQLVRGYSAGQQREQLIVRVIGRADSAELTAAARSLLDDFPQIAAEIASGEPASALVEFRDPPATLAGHWKIPLYVDERTTPEGTPCPSE